MMDIHPLVIHYPIALLTTYVLFEIFRIKPEAKVTILILGEISAIVTHIAARFSPALSVPSALSDTYKMSMLITAIIFGLITLMYISKKDKTIVIIPLSLIGLFSVVVSGGLFGATVYGTHFDPYLAPIFKILGVY